MVVDSGCFRHLGPADETAECLSNSTVITDEHVLTADGSGGALDIVLRGILNGKCKTERGYYKDIELQFSGVTNLRKWLFSVPGAVRNRHIIHLEQESDGGSWLQFHGSCERIPIGFV